MRCLDDESQGESVQSPGVSVGRLAPLRDHGSNCAARSLRHKAQAGRLALQSCGNAESCGDSRREEDPQKTPRLQGREHPRAKTATKAWR